jgi:hypothetical protein
MNIPAQLRLGGYFYLPQPCSCFIVEDILFFLIEVRCMPSEAVYAARRRQRRLLREYRNERRQCKVKLITGRLVIFEFRGIEVDFEYRDGLVIRGSLRSQFLREDDWAFLFTLAEELMRACFEGYKTRHRGKTRTAAVKEQLRALEAMNPRQRHLF